MRAETKNSIKSGLILSATIVILIAMDFSIGFGYAHDNGPLWANYGWLVLVHALFGWMAWGMQAAFCRPQYDY